LSVSIVSRKRGFLKGQQPIDAARGVDILDSVAEQPPVIAPKAVRAISITRS
jgi:hypothetical protein